MTAKSIVAVIAGVLVAAAVTYHFVRRPPPAPAPGAEATRELPAPAIEARSVPEASTRPGDSTPSTVHERESDVYTAHQPGVGMIEYETIDGVRVKKDRNCTFRFVKNITRPDGTISPIYDCEPNEQQPVDIYTTYSNEALKTLAYSDPHAAHVLSLRFREKDFSEAISYALRSSVLADNNNSIRWLLSNYPTPTYTNGQVQVQAVEDNYVLSGVIYALGGPGEDLMRWTSIAHEHAKDGIDTEVLDDRIADLMDTVEIIRSEVGID